MTFPSLICARNCRFPETRPWQPLWGPFGVHVVTCWCFVMPSAGLRLFGSSSLSSSLFLFTNPGLFSGLMVFSLRLFFMNTLQEACSSPRACSSSRMLSSSLMHRSRVTWRRAHGSSGRGSQPGDPARPSPGYARHDASDY